MKKISDIGTNLSVLKKRYEEIDFTYINEEKWWNFKDEKEEEYDKIEKEKLVHVKMRLLIFFIWILLRKENNICFISHQRTFKILFQIQNKSKIKNADFRILNHKILEEFITSNLKKFLLDD